MSATVGTINESTGNISEYFSLKKTNQQLAEENARLRSLLLSLEPLPTDSLAGNLIPVDSADTTALSFELITAEIIRNDIRSTKNFFMINKGAKDGIEEGMGVINSLGVVGKIRGVSKEFSEGISLLNIKNPTSVKHQPSGRMGTVLWEGVNPKTARLLYLTPDVPVEPGDTIVTSGYNAIFPKEIMVGTVRSSEPDKNNTYLNIEIDLSVDFGSLSFVYIIKNHKKPEQDSLINLNPEIINE
ncbi:cell shape-determining protein MreC [Roseivirga thermotolerans]|jgi:rod shape-determining protein MreC|uniref:Cell shape-determining protein MreC n=2 Tax=Roseivirgaceae TaxID=2762306 RepID=A0ABQ3I0U3_9BACT|nr:cell shape-determining protein MreC [Roseivirga thermotolerans]|tara:strand:- start:17689 stop:18417 length:729 start_codon:yes stop_codon:yes gene_type:complete